MSKDRTIATLTVYRVSHMTAKGRREVCDWLRGVARDLQAEPYLYADTFRARRLRASKEE